MSDGADEALRPRRTEPRRVRGPVAAIGLVVFIGLMTVVAALIHRDNLRARAETRRAMEAESSGTDARERER